MCFERQARVSNFPSHVSRCFIPVPQFVFKSPVFLCSIPGSLLHLFEISHQGQTSYRLQRAGEMLRNVAIKSYLSSSTLALFLSNWETIDLNRAITLGNLNSYLGT